MRDDNHRHVSDVINARGLSGLQFVVFALCFLTVAVDGFDTAAIGFLAPAVAREWHLVPQALTMLFGAGTFGAVAGSAFLGPVADTLGRSRTMLICTALFGIFSVCSGFADTLTALTTLRFLSGIGLGGLLPCAIALTAEYSPDLRRSSLITAMFCGFTLGSSSGGFISAWIVPDFGWRTVLIAGGTAPLVIAGIGMFILPESLNFLMSRNVRHGEVRRTLARIAPELASTGWMPEAEPVTAGTPIGVLFKARPIWGTLLLWLMSFMGMLCIYLLSNWMPELLTEQGYSLRQASLVTAMFQIGGTSGAILLGMAMDRFRPTKVLATAWAFAGLFVISIGSLAAAPVAAAIAIFLSGFCIPGGQVGASAYAAAWYPTKVRTTGVSWMSGIGYVGSLVGSVSAGGLIAAGFGTKSIVALLAIPMVIAAIAMTLHERFPASNGRR